MTQSSMNIRMTDGGGSTQDPLLMAVFTGDDAMTEQEVADLVAGILDGSIAIEFRCWSGRLQNITICQKGA